VEDLQDLRLDHDRPRRTGDPEVVYAEPKTPDQCARAVAGLLAGGGDAVLATRARPDQADAVVAACPGAVYDPVARVVVARRAPRVVPGRVAVVAAGTSDLPVARECAVVLEALGVHADEITDVGIAGLHRLVAVRDRLAAADVVVVIAGMEGALPTAVAGLVAAPIVAVPTSVGYGAAFEGLAALLGMLTSCAPGIAVVNIDNGFGAAVVARRILTTGPPACAGQDGP
jgi:NCAIR mutase (PurE)-related protein